MRYAALASGSNGNCYYVAHEQDAILIDIGILAKNVERRMANLGIVPTSIKAIFITHEHTDHVRGLAVFCKRYQIPVYMTGGTFRGSRLSLPEHLIHLIRADEAINIGGLQVRGVPKYHDAAEPCSFLVSNGNVNMGVLTDIGRVCDNVKEVIRQADVLLLEANYDESLLDTGSYPFFLKNRIRNGWGHLANRLALDAILAYGTPRLRHLILGHLSGRNNKAEIVYGVFAAHCQRMKLSIASRDQETELFSASPRVVYQQATLVFPEE